MFNCEICKKKVDSKIRCVRMVMEKRVKFYPFRSKANRGYTFHNGSLKRSGRPIDRADDPGGRGWEIVCEKRACPDCIAKHALTIAAE